MNDNIPAGIDQEQSGSWATSRLPDVDIIARVLAGDSAAYEGIMRRYNRRLYRIARGITTSDEDAKDVVQESYVRAYFRLAQFQGPDGFASWISRIVINEAISRGRKRRLSYDNAVNPDDLAIDTNNRPENIAMGDDTLQMIETAIDKLPLEFRIVFMLRGVEELSVKETADLLNIKPATVKTRFHRARILVKKTLSRRLNDLTPSTFSFDGRRCDSIVGAVFAAVAGVRVDQH